MRKSRLLKWSSTSEAFGSLAIVAALIFLAVQTNRNTDAINAQVIASEAESKAATFEVLNKSFEQIIEYPEIMVDLHSTKSLKSEEESRLIAWMVSLWDTREFAWLQYRDGIIDQASFDTYIDQRWFFATERGREWWDANAVSNYDPEFVELINSQYRH